MVVISSLARQTAACLITNFGVVDARLSGAGKKPTAVLQLVVDSSGKMKKSASMASKLVVTAGTGRDRAEGEEEDNTSRPEPGTLPEDQVFGREEEEEEEAPESSKDKEEAGEQGPAQGDDQATDTTNTTLDMSGDCRMQEVNGTMALVESHASCCSFTHKAYASQCCRADGSHMKTHKCTKMLQENKQTENLKFYGDVCHWAKDEDPCPKPKSKSSIGSCC